MSHHLAYHARIYTALHPYLSVYECMCVFVCDAQISEIPNSSTTPHLFKPNRTNSNWMMAPTPLFSLYYCVIVFVYTARFVVYFVILSINTILTVFSLSFLLTRFFSLLKTKQTWNESYRNRHTAMCGRVNYTHCTQCHIFCQHQLKLSLFMYRKFSLFSPRLFLLMITS